MLGRAAVSPSGGLAEARGVASGGAVLRLLAVAWVRVAPRLCLLRLLRLSLGVALAAVRRLPLAVPASSVLCSHGPLRRLVLLGHLRILCGTLSRMVAYMLSKGVIPHLCISPALEPSLVLLLARLVDLSCKGLLLVAASRAQLTGPLLGTAAPRASSLGRWRTLDGKTTAGCGGRG